MKRKLKALVQRGVAMAAPAILRSRRESLLILMYHRVLPVGHPDRASEQPGMYVSPETLDMHLSLLSRSFSLIELGEWLDRAKQNLSLPPRACAITFDDGWRDNYDFAFPVLKRHQVPATIYLVSDLVGTSYSFWPNIVLEYLRQAASRDQWPDWLRQASPAVESARLAEDEIERIVARLKATYTDREMMSLAEPLRQNPDASRRNLMSWDEVRQMASGGMIRFGSHTRHHTRLTGSLPRELIQDEIVSSARVIEEQIGVRPSTFCYPNGDHCEAAVEIVRGAYIGAVTTRTGWNSAQYDPCLLKRVGMHDDVSLTPSSFISRICGVG